MPRTRSFWGSTERNQSGGSVDFLSEVILEVRANTVYRLTGYRFFLSGRLQEDWSVDATFDFVVALTVWEPSTAMTVASALDSRQTQAGLFALPGKGTIDVLLSKDQVDFETAVGIGTQGQDLDSGWVACDLVIPSLVLTGVDEALGMDVNWQMFCVSEYETKRVGANEAASIAKAWGVPKPHETTW